MGLERKAELGVIFCCLFGVKNRYEANQILVFYKNSSVIRA
jgi:hypothetical protein